jgi:aminoglycoside 6'-N-acetyltransferase I
MNGPELMMTVRPAEPRDAATWLQLREAFWPDGSEAEHREEIDQFFAGSFPRDPWIVLLAENSEGAVGLAELSIRPYAEGCRSSRVGYLEGWFVVPRWRNRGVGRLLVAAGEQWARSLGCSEFASDTDPENDASRAAHRALGFVEVGLVRCFRKDL